MSARIIADPALIPILAQPVFLRFGDGFAVDPFLLYQVKHGGIGGAVNSPVGRELCFTGLRPYRRVGQVVFKGFQGLFSQGDAVHQEQNALNPVGSGQHIQKSHAGSRFPRARGHDQKELAMFLFHALQHGAYGLNLIWTARDGSID